MTDGVLEFREEDHSYRLDGVSVPGVTGALQVISAAAYAHVDPEVLAAKAELGRAVHRLIELDCMGDLDVEALSAELVPYYVAWRTFLRTSGFSVVLSEGKVYSRRYSYAGQLDLFGRLNGILSLIDAKCVVTVMPSTGPQTRAYEVALRECRPDVLAPDAPCRRYALQLKPSPTLCGAIGWSLHPFANDGADLKLFLSCLNVTHHLRRYRL